MIVHAMPSQDHHTPCGEFAYCPVPGTFHTPECLAGQQVCIGLHATAINMSPDPSIVNCPGCLAHLEQQ